MGRSISRSLARLHAEFKVYPPTLFNVDRDRNIIHRIEDIAELSYLQEFYRVYETEYLAADIGQIHPLHGPATSVDLPFVGRSVVEFGKAEYMFVFEGSLSPPERLSNTVLSCLWPIESLREFQSIFETFWPRTYDRIIKYLGITVEIAKKSYVIDAVRIGSLNGRRDTQACRSLLHQEIALLRPRLIVLVGGSAAQIMGNERQRPDGEFMTVPFPRPWLNAQQIAVEAPLYENLRGRFAELEKL